MRPAGGADALVAAVVDVGSNSVLLLTVRVRDDGRVRQCDAALATTRLGSGLDSGGRLVPEAWRRTRAAVAAMVDRARDRGASRCWAFATGAARRASDGQAFAADVARAARCPVDVLSGDEEATLAYAAVCHALATDATRRMLAVDVGGVTTELTLGCGALIEERVSLPLGALALTESATDPAAEVDRILADTELLARAAGAEVVCSGGTATALAALDLELATYDPGRVHGHVLARARLGELVGRARALPGALDEGRARILPAGAVVLAAVAGAAGAPVIRVSEHGVRHGYLRRQLAREGVDADLRALWA